MGLTTPLQFKNSTLFNFFFGGGGGEMLHSI